MSDPEQGCKFSCIALQTAEVKERVFVFCREQEANGKYFSCKVVITYFSISRFKPDRGGCAVIT